MATFIPAPKTVRIAQNWFDEDGHDAQCRFYLQYSGSEGVAAEYTAIAAACSASVTANIVPSTHNTWTTGESVATDLSSDTSPEGTSAGGVAGTLAGGRLPASTALVVSQQTGRRYRGGHSRVYLPVGDDTKLNTDALWSAGFVGTTEANWALVVSDTSSGFAGHFGTITQVMASFYSGFTNVPYGTPLKYRRVPTGRAAAVNYPVINYVGKEPIGTQRRRLRA